MFKIILDKKKLGIVLITAGLMITLFVLGNKLEHRIKYTVLIQNNIKSLKQYDIVNSGLTYKLPSDWKTSIKSFSGTEIIYHNDFISEDALIHGFVQVWNMEEDIKIFLDKSKKISEQQNAYTSYEIKPIKVGDKSGYLLIYSIITPENLNYQGYEYFIKLDKKFIRFAFYVRSENFKEKLPGIFQTIVNTLKSI